MTHIEAKSIDKWLRYQLKQVPLGICDGPDGSFRSDLSYVSLDISAIHQWILLQYGSFESFSQSILETKIDLINRMDNNRLSRLIDSIVVTLLAGLRAHQLQRARHHRRQHHLRPGLPGGGGDGGRSRRGEQPQVGQR